MALVLGRVVEPIDDQKSTAGSEFMPAHVRATTNGAPASAVFRPPKWPISVPYLGVETARFLLYLKGGDEARAREYYHELMRAPLWAETAQGQGAPFVIFQGASPQDWFNTLDERSALEGDGVYLQSVWLAIVNHAYPMEEMQLRLGLAHKRQGHVYITRDVLVLRNELRHWDPSGRKSFATLKRQQEAF